MIPLEKFLECVRENAARVHSYELGCDGSDGKCDCIGLIIGALALAGFRWPGVHGSNWAARNAMDGLEPVGSAGEAFLGEIVYKAREPGEAGYALPDRYKDGEDLRDYYHVGVVTSVDPFRVTHCTNVEGGVKYDTALGAWRWGGRLKYVDYEEGGEETSYWAAVTAESGKTVNLRAKPDKKSAIIARVPLGTQVRATVYDPDPAWRRVETGGKTGYMMAEYLRPASDGGETVAVERNTLEAWADALENTAREIRALLARE